MNTAANCPVGADSPSAPWNQVSSPPREFEVTISETLSKNTKVKTDDYVEEYEPDEFLSSCDTSSTDWVSAYECNHYTPYQLIALFKSHLEIEMKRSGDTINKKEYSFLIKECSDWLVDEIEVIKN